MTRPGHRTRRRRAPLTDASRRGSAAQPAGPHPLRALAVRAPQAGALRASLGLLTILLSCQAQRNDPDGHQAPTNDQAPISGLSGPARTSGLGGQAQRRGLGGSDRDVDKPARLHRPRLGAATARIEGARLHIMTRSSMLISERSSAYSEIDFCPGGVFFDRTETSVRVGGRYNAAKGGREASASGASLRKSSGTWSVVEGTEGARLRILYRSGNAAEYAVAEVLSGAWRRARTRFAMGWNKAECNLQ